VARDRQARLELLGNEALHSQCGRDPPQQFEPVDDGLAALVNDPIFHGLAIWLAFGLASSTLLTLW